jgi:hypothetical protein
MQNRCFCCKFWKKKEDAGSSYGECRRYPRTTDKPWPYTKNIDWCGEYKKVEDGE